LANQKQQGGAAILDHIYYSSLGLVRFAVTFTSVSSELYKFQQDWCQTLLLSQTNMFWLFFIQFEFAGSGNEHSWNCSENVGASNLTEIHYCQN
jgi:hypothetical protein